MSGISKIHQPPQLGRLLTPEEVAQRLGGVVSPRWVVEHVRPRVEINRRVIRWYEADVEAWLASRRAA